MTAAVTFRPAVRENVNLLIGLAGASGSGKTFTAMRLASGMTPAGKRFAVIDTENGRASHYADQFQFDVAELHAPFTPERYGQAIKAADDAGYPVIVVDSMSHEYAGEGGILDMQEAEFEKMNYSDAKKMLSWVKPKMAHKAMVQTLLQRKASLILCFRAEAKVDMVKDGAGKTQIVPKKSLVGLDGWIPVTEKTLPFELTVSLLLTPDRPGIPHPIKLQQQHKAMFPLDREITEESGKRILEWSRGGAVPASREKSDADFHREAESHNQAGRITPREAADLEAYCTEKSVSVAGLLKAAGVKAVEQLPDAKRAREWVDKQVAAREAAIRG